MARTHNTTKDGDSWSDDTIQKVWSKGQMITGYSSQIWRWDKCGDVMKFSEHGNRKSKQGWEIDHIIPVSLGGDDNLTNLQPLNWSNNASKSDKKNWKCSEK